MSGRNRRRGAKQACCHSNRLRLSEVACLLVRNIGIMKTKMETTLIHGVVI